MSATQDENTGLQIRNKAITVETTIEINHYQMGQLFADWNNVDQAAFLYGAAHGFDSLDGWAPMQASFITHAAEVEGWRPITARFIELLHEYFKDDDALA